MGAPPDPFLKWSAWVRWHIDWRYHQAVCLIRGHSWDDYYCERSRQSYYRRKEENV